MTSRTLIGHLAAHARAKPGSLALAFGTTAISYGELWQRLLRAADFLREEGVEHGDRVLLAALREPEFVCAYFACHLLGAIAVPYEPDIAPSKLLGIIELLDPKITLTSRDAPPEAMKCRPLRSIALADAAALPHTDGFVEPNPDATADVLLTSGTTGRPKGVMLTHRNILAAAQNINQFIGNTAGDREAVALPISHSFGLGRIRCQILVGGALILTSGFQFPKQIFDAMRSWRATGFSFVPAAWAMLKRLTGERLAEFAADLSYLEIGSASMARADKEHLMRLFPQTRICMHYGLTEASRSAFIEFHQANDRLDSIGRATPNVDIRIIDPEGHELGPYQIGKIAISGPHVTAGYWAANSNEHKHGATLYSGDLGYRDADGYIYLCGREDDVINIGGRKVYPTEIEQALLAHDQIIDAVCVSSSDPLTGEAVRALLVAKCDGSELPGSEALGEFLRARLEQYKIPAQFTWVASIPRNATGKVDRKSASALPGQPAAKVDAEGPRLNRTYPGVAHHAPPANRD